MEVRCGDHDDLFWFDSDLIPLNRSLRWLDRCIAAHGRPDEQSLFPIVQGGLDEKLREQSVKGSVHHT